MDMQGVRADFPILSRTVNNKPLVYFDNAATTQKPVQVMQAMDDYYRQHNANIHRGIHALAEEATEAHENARAKIAKLINAKPEEMVFTRGTTEAINLVAYSWALNRLQKGDEIVSTVMEHHSNLVTWQFLRAKGVTVKHADIKDDGTLDLDNLAALLTDKTRLVTLTQVSNVLGTINPVRAVAKLAHENGALVLVDAAQSVPHMPVDVKSLDCDFLALSGHKMLGPTGIGCLYGRKHLLEGMEPFMFGGEMIREVHLDSAKWNELPYKFEAGTPNIAGAIGLGAAVDYLNRIGLETIRRHEVQLTEHALEALREVKGLQVYGPAAAEDRGGVISFNLADIHAHDMATILDSEGIAVRSGHHCAQPLMERLGLPATSRASFYLYNTAQEVDKLAETLQQARKVFKLK
ncbi:MAG: cysteine desulfurase [Candidatus Aenigmarchaeota archaeon]|nr:cysteine desulfurase [Candidatus Aenigmarchaeota archaeon]